MFDSPFQKHIGFTALSAKQSADYEILVEESRLLSPLANEQRKREFHLGRAAARQALKNIGIPNPPPLLKGQGREPLWPNGIVGSISHADNWAVAAAAKTEIVSALGIDIQALHHQPTKDISSRVCTERELEWVRSSPSLFLARLLTIFSAKESVFKAFYPRYQRHIGFKEAELVWDDALKGFSAKLLSDLGPRHGKGFSFTVGARTAKGYVLTFVELEN